MPAVPPPPNHAVSRPRVEGDREVEILKAALRVLAEVGYDRVTMDAVATAAKASKATLYRRWSNKATLVIDALLLLKDPPALPDEGSLREDLLATFCGIDGMLDEESVATLGSIITAINRDQEFAAEFRSRVIGPKNAITIAIFERAKARGEVREDLDPELFGPALAGMILHRVFVLGNKADRPCVTSLIDQIILPAALRTPH
ncbi:MAG: TetR/AcrR family transcriptional regulator [Nocardioides sp.]|nr:TetR/AcrR family transcriptional regulator [Nocardioides sp.]